MLTNRDVAVVLAKATERRDAILNLNAEQRDRLLAAIALDETARTQGRIKTIDLLNEIEGRYSLTHTLEGRSTLEQILADSREGEE